MQIQFDSANIRLVRDGFGKYLQHNRKAKFRSEPGSLVFAGRNARLHRGDAVKRQQLLRFNLGKQNAAVAPRILNDLLDLIARDVLQLRVFRECGSFVESAQVVGVAPHVGEGARCGIGIRKGWNAR